MSPNSLVIILNLLSHKVERPLTFSHAEGDLAYQTDQKFVNWLLKTQTKFLSHLCPAKVIFLRLLVNIFYEGKCLFSVNIKILQRYLNMLGLMKKNDRTVLTGFPAIFTEGSRGFPQFLKRMQ